MVQLNLIAVITGDIVNSSRLSEEEKGDILSWINQLTGEDLLLKPKFFRGDSFQLAAKPKAALALALKCRTELRSRNESSDARISIGIGEVTSWNNDVLLSNGPAFERSGKNLDELKNKGLRIIIVTGNKELDKELETYCVMAEPYINNFTSAQAKVISCKLEDMPQDKIGEILHISQPAVSKALKAAHWKAIHKFVERYGQIIEKNYGTFE